MTAIPISALSGFVLLVGTVLLTARPSFQRRYLDLKGADLQRANSTARRLSRAALVFALLAPLPLGWFFGRSARTTSSEISLALAILMIMAAAAVFWINRRIVLITGREIDKPAS